jgi:PAS domain S-box-containing protein
MENREHASTTLSSKLSRNNRFLSLILLTCFLTISVIFSFTNYLLFHIVVELFSITIAIAAFLIIVNSPSEGKSNYIQFVGYSFAFISLLDLVHTITYKGMNIIPNLTANTPTQLWIAARYLQSISLVAANYYHTKRLNRKTVIGTYLATVIILLASIFVFDIFPVCYVEGVGLTRFKIVSEYLISLILVASLVLLIQNREKYPPSFIRGLVGAVVFTIVSEIAFTFYVSVYGFSNLVGHIAKLIAFYIFYEVVIRTSVKDPLEYLYGSLSQSEEQFRGFMESASERFVIFDKDMHFKVVNDSWLQQGSLNREDVIGKHVLEVFPRLKETEQYDEYLKVLETGEPVVLHAVESVADEQNIVDISAFKAGNVLGIVARDVSENRKYQRRLETLHSHAAAMSIAESIEEIAEISKKSLLNVLGSKQGSLGLVEGAFLNHRYRWGVESLEEFRMSLDGPGITVEAVNTGKSIRIGNIDDIESYVVGVNVTRFHSELAVPVKVLGTVVAVLNLESKVHDAYSENDQKLVETLASHIASALSRLDYLNQLKSSVIELEASKESWQDLIESIPDPVMINDGSKWLYVNQQAAELFGKGIPSEIIGRDVKMFFSEEDGKMLQQRAKDRLTGRVVSSKYEQIFRTWDGVLVPVEVNVRVINFNGMLAILGIHRDISERKQSEQRLSALHSFTIDLDTNETVNDVVETSFRIMTEILGFSFISFQLLKNDELVTLDTRGRQSLGMRLPLTGKGVTTRAAREARTVLLGDVRDDPDYIRGSSESLSELAVPIVVEGSVLGVLNVESLQLDAFTDDDARLLEVLAQNVGATLSRISTVEDRLELERQVLVQQTQVEQEMELSRLKTQFMNTAAHEIRTPITSIQGYTELIQDHIASSDDEVLVKYFDAVARNSKRLDKLSNDLLDLQRMEAGRMRLDKEFVSVSDVLDGVEVELSPILASKGQKLDIRGSLGGVVFFVDVTRLMQVLVNLVHNASKFSGEGETIRINVVSDVDGVSFAVVDDGVGMEEADLVKLFEPFPDIFVDGVTSGSGLGLSICKGIVELHGGEIWAESEGHGKGSKFSFTIPIEQ